MILKIITSLLITFSIASPSFAVTYLLQDLGTNGGLYSSGSAINDLGHVTGMVQANNFAIRAFFWDGNSMLNLGSPAGGASSGNDINNNDQIVGHAGFKSFRWTPATGFVFLDPNNFGVANGINNVAEVVGASYSTDQSLYWNSANTQSAINPATLSEARAINNLSQIVGSISGVGYYATSHNAPFQTIPITPESINDSRLIVGDIGNSTAAIYDYDTNTLTSLGYLSPNHQRSAAIGVNNSGTVVGFSRDTNMTDQRAFIYDSVNGMQDLTSLLHSNFGGWKILAAADINENGQIVANGEFNFNGNIETHAVILTPIPEPMSIIIASVVVAIVTTRRVWSRKNVSQS
jgi:probable HAF family extracellular repeat protein